MRLEINVFREAIGNASALNSATLFPDPDGCYAPRGYYAGLVDMHGKAEFSEDDGASCRPGASSRPGTDGLRRHEVAVHLPPADDARIRFIGRLHTPWPLPEDCPRQGSPDGPQCRIEVFEPWVSALAGLERLQTLEVLYWLDQARRDLTVQNPGRSGNALGTFALRSPLRPNPVGTARVRLEEIEGRWLRVRGLDCCDGTPLIDLKPDRCPFAARAKPED